MSAYGISTIKGDRGQEFAETNLKQYQCIKEKKILEVTLKYFSVSSITEHLIVCSGTDQMIRCIGIYFDG